MLRENVAATKGFEGFKGFIAMESVSIPFQSCRHSLLDSMASLAVSFFLSSRVGKETPETPEEDLHGSGVVNRCCGPGAGKTKEEGCALERCREKRHRAFWL